MAEDFLAKLKEMRDPVAAGGSPRPELAAYVEKVKKNAWKVTDEDVASLLAAGLSQDEIYYATMYAAMTAGIERAEIGLRALKEAK
jgi:alkylhydroperoxidase family enzyme